MFFGPCKSSNKTTKWLNNNSEAQLKWKQFIFSRGSNSKLSDPSAPRIPAERKKIAISRWSLLLHVAYATILFCFSVSPTFIYLVLVCCFYKGSKCTSYYNSHVSKSTASDIVHFISTNIYWSSALYKELWKGDRLITPSRGCCSPILGADTNIIRETVIFTLIRGITWCTMFKLEGWASSRRVAFVGGLEML